jgi:hypothetical protein
MRVVPPLCGSPFQTIEYEEDAAAIPSALADIAWMEKSASLGEVVRLLLRRAFFPNMDWCQSLAEWNSAETLSFFIEGEELRAFAAEKEGGDLLSVQGCCLGIAKRVARGEWLEGLHKDLYRQHDARCGYGGMKNEGKGVMACMDLGGSMIILGRGGYRAMIVGK